MLSYKIHSNSNKVLFLTENSSEQIEQYAIALRGSVACSQTHDQRVDHRPERQWSLQAVQPQTAPVIPRVPPGGYTRYYGTALWQWDWGIQAQGDCFAGPKRKEWDRRWNLERLAMVFFYGSYQDACLIGWIIRLGQRLFATLERRWILSRVSIRKDFFVSYWGRAGRYWLYIRELWHRRRQRQRKRHF